VPNSDPFGLQAAASPQATEAPMFTMFTPKEDAPPVEDLEVLRSDVNDDPFNLNTMSGSLADAPHMAAPELFAAPPMGMPPMGGPPMSMPPMGAPAMGPPRMGLPKTRMGPPGMGPPSMGPPSMGPPSMGAPTLFTPSVPTNLNSAPPPMSLDNIMAPKLPLNDEPPTLTLDTNIIQPDNLGGISIFKPETVEQDNKQEIVKPVEDLFSADDGWDNDFNSWEDQDPNFEDIQL